jgi:hypothetical protein
VAGDVVYNRTHMYLAESTTASRREWIATLTKLKDLDPLHVVAAAHKQPDGTDDPTDIDESILYLIDFNDAGPEPPPRQSYTRLSYKSIPNVPTPDRPGAQPKAPRAAGWPAIRPAASNPPVSRHKS